jgi:hypothetical protein
MNCIPLVSYWLLHSCSCTIRIESHKTRLEAYENHFLAIMGESACRKAYFMSEGLRGEEMLQREVIIVAILEEQRHRF